MYFLLMAVALVTLPFFLFKLSGKEALSDFVNTNKTSMKLINVVNFIYKIISIFKTEQNHCVIDSLIVYPIKSTGKGLKVKEWQVGEVGLMYDRQYVFARFDDKKLKEWVPVTLKDCVEFITIEYEYTDDGFFIIKYGQGKFFKLPMQVTQEYLNSVRTQDEVILKLWQEHINSIDISSVVPRDFFEFFKLPPETKLLYTVEGHPVKQGSMPNLSNTIADSKYRISAFLDYYPFLLLSKSGVRHLNSKLANTTQFADFKVNEQTFRPNIVVEGDIRPHDEDTWYRFRVNTKADGKQHYFNTCIKCARCNIPNIDLEGDQKLNKKGPVTKTLSKYRRVDIGDKYSAYFGVYAIQHETGYTIRAGDPIDILQRKVNFFDSPFGTGGW